MRALDYMRLREKYVETDSAKMGGVPVIRGTRVPMRTLAQLVEGGENRRALREDDPHIPKGEYDVAALLARVIRRRGRPVGGSRARANGRAAAA